MTYGIIAQEVEELILKSVSAPPENNIVFHAGPAEMLKVTKDGFYVRGVKVEADDKESAAVYNWLIPIADLDGDIRTQGTVRIMLT